MLTLLLINVSIMICCWLWASLNSRAGIVDAAWSFCIALNIGLTAFIQDQAPLSVRYFLGILSSIWFLRLAGHLLRRYLDEQVEDRRYANMRRAMGKYQHLGFFCIFYVSSGFGDFILITHDDFTQYPCSSME